MLTTNYGIPPQEPHQLSAETIKDIQMHIRVAMHHIHEATRKSVGAELDLTETLIGYQHDLRRRVRDIVEAMEGQVA